ncbi:hypothetical protein GQF42_16765 [Streptomyces broussonetiae]|uniref:Uncharacterized protein n=1 Tax=Streptomyces broussonetiae TaxID=2686304 RepID=A0A6I6N6Z2_9ACTN|nr:hypothetical protein [Streptomyces broussonetiae]QHA04725.1 hypothetical protein GQF42_16765 [Streptomyces broussonetiae]
MPILGSGGLPALDVHPIQTLACGSDSRNKTKIVLLIVLACVINGDSLTNVLQQATWLVVSITVLIIVQVVAGHLRWAPAKPPCRI